MKMLVLFLATLPAAAQIAPARIGCFIDGRQRLREVYGTAGNFVVSEPKREGALAALCTAGLTIVKSENDIEVNGVVYAAPPGRASIEPDGLVCYENGECERFGTVRAKTGPVPLIAEGRRSVTVGECRTELPAEAESLHFLGPGWFRIVLAGGGHAALSLAKLAVYGLPEVAP